MVALTIVLSLVLSFTAIAAPDTSASDQKNLTLVVNTTGKEPMSTKDHNGFIDQIATEAFRRCGVNLVIDHLPAERALRNANKGILDGDLMRIEGLEKIYPDLIRVPEKLVDWYFVAFSTKPVDMSKGWGSLENHNVALITGWKIYENNVPKSAKITRVKDAEQLFTLLSRRRADVVLYNHSSGKEVIQKLGLTGITEQKPPLAVKQMYIYLNRKHAALVPGLAKALADMKADGTYARLSKNNIASLGNSQ